MDQNNSPAPWIHTNSFHLEIPIVEEIQPFFFTIFLLQDAPYPHQLLDEHWHYCLYPGHIYNISVYKKARDTFNEFDLLYLIWYNFSNPLQLYLICYSDLLYPICYYRLWSIWAPQSHWRLFLCGKRWVNSARAYFELTFTVCSYLNWRNFHLLYKCVFLIFF